MTLGNDNFYDNNNNNNSAYFFLWQELSNQLQASTESRRDTGVL
jgi:hypothetical protein